MKIILKSFANIREIIGQKELELELSDGANVNTVLQKLIEMFPKLRQVLFIQGVFNTDISVVHRDSLVKSDKFETQVVEDNDVVVLLPPTGGG